MTEAEIKALGDLLWGELCKRGKQTAAPHAYTVIRLMAEMGMIEKGKNDE